MSKTTAGLLVCVQSHGAKRMREVPLGNDRNIRKNSLGNDTVNGKSGLAFSYTAIPRGHNLASA